MNRTRVITVQIPRADRAFGFVLGRGIQAGVGYIAQVLKRNRTLRVCNLAENKIDVAGLVALAEALVSLG